MRSDPHTFPTRHLQGGFNLIEMLIAMTVIMTVVALACMVLTESEQAWFLGTGQADTQAAGRAAISMMSRDLQHAVADTTRTFFLEPDSSSVSYGFTNSDIRFVSLLNSAADSNRVARATYYWVRPCTNNYEQFELVRGCHIMANPGDTNSVDNFYWDPGWYNTPRPAVEDTGVLAENVTALTFVTPEGENFYLSSNPEHSNQVPEYLDVFLELADKRAVKRAADMPPSQGQQHIERNTTRFTTRVFLQNRYDYRK